MDSSFTHIKFSIVIAECSVHFDTYLIQLLLFPALFCIGLRHTCTYIVSGLWKCVMQCSVNLPTRLFRLSKVESVHLLFSDLNLCMFMCFGVQSVLV